MGGKEDERFDGLFINVAQSAGGLEGLLGALFSFLARKTDFYHQDDESICKNLLMKHYDNNRELAWSVLKKQQEEKESRVKEQVIKKTHKEAVRTVDNDRIEEIDEVENSHPNNKKLQPEIMSNSDEQNDGEKPPEGNGGITDKYRWVQTLSTVDVSIPIGDGSLKGRDLFVEITSSTLKVKRRNEQEYYLDGVLCSRVKTDDCTWVINDGKVLQITLEKLDGMHWWECVLKGDATIDTKKIVPENSKLSDLDGETRATVEKMLYDQRRQQMGLPTSDQQKQHDLLEKFKKAHPEMDFSKAKVNYGNGGSSGMPSFS